MTSWVALATSECASQADLREAVVHQSTKIDTVLRGAIIPKKVKLLLLWLGIGEVA